MYDMVTGPLAWFSFLVFFIGMIYRVVWYIRGLDWKLDRVAYRPHFMYGMKGAIRSILFWIVPFATHGWRKNPGFTVLFAVFHFGLLFTPLFLSAHNILLAERWGFSLPTIPNGLADVLTLAVIVSALFLALRRIAMPEVRILTTAYDYALLLIAVAPFVTGILAFHQASDYSFWLTAHILSGEVWLIAIPFTKLSHFALFFLSRGQIGMDYGIKRGGMKSKGMAW